MFAPHLSSPLFSSVLFLLVCQLPIRGVTADAVKEAVVLGKSSNGPMTVMMHELKVAYELLLDAKRHKQRIADVVLAAQDCSRTPPAAGTSPRILGANSTYIPPLECIHQSIYQTKEEIKMGFEGYVCNYSNV